MYGNGNGTLLLSQCYRSLHLIADMRNFLETEKTQECGFQIYEVVIFHGFVVLHGDYCSGILGRNLKFFVNFKT